jgi:hypothetical protein
MKKIDRVTNALSCGNFTVAYHDNGQWTIHRGKHEYDDLPKRQLAETDDFFLLECGYAPDIVVLLVKALNGKVVSI